MIMKRLIKNGILGIILLSLIATSFPNNEEWKTKVNPNLMDQAKSSEIVEIMVLFQSEVDLAPASQMKTKEDKGRFVFHQLQGAATKNQHRVRKFLNSRNISFQSFVLANAIFLKGDLNLIKSLAGFDEVKKLINNPTVRLDAPFFDAEANSRGPQTVEWGIEMIGADQVWDMGYRGEGVTVAGEDTGYEWEHPALKHAYRGWDGNTANHNFNWHDAIHEINLNNDSIADPSLNDCGLDSPFPCDDNNHGTLTMGIIVGEDGENQIGVAPAAKWMACRNMERGAGTPATYIECFEFFLAPTDLNNENPDPAKAPHVINNSWLCPESEGCNSDNWEMMEMVINNLKAAGIVVVASAGNAGPNCSTVYAPAAMFDNSFTIGSTKSNDEISGFSSRGPVAVDASGRLKPNVVAPGSNIRSSIRNGNYASGSGTSLSGPHVAGLVALMISANPELAGNVEQIESIIENTAIPKMSTDTCGNIPGSEIPNHTYGFGRIDAVAAVEESLSMTTSVEGHTRFQDLKVYPNPSTDQVFMDFGDRKGLIEIQLFDVHGRSILNKKAEFNGLLNLDLSHLNTGFYIFKAKWEGELFKGKIVLE